MRKLIFLLFFLNKSFLKAEYIFFNTTHHKPQKLSTQEHEGVYHVLINYSFPMNTNPTLSYKTSLQEQGGVYTDEMGFLKKKLNDHQGIAFIPKTLYELFILHFWLEGKLIIPYYKDNILLHRSPFEFPQETWPDKQPILTEVPFKHPVKSLLHRLDNLWKCKEYGDNERNAISFEIYQELNKLEDIKTLHLIINNEILDYFDRCQLDVANLTHESVDLILDDLLHCFDFWHHRLTLAFSRVFTERFLYGVGFQKSLLKNIIHQELAFENAGLFLLYRGTHGWQGRNSRIDSTLTVRDGYIYSNSISYGNTVFAAALGNDCDDQGAMAYNYLVRSSLAYALKVDKYEYAAGEVKSLFFIPPITTLVGLACHGELFHARTKGALTLGEKLCGMWFFNTGDYSLPLFLVSSNKDKIEFEQKFSHYLIKNIILLKNETMIPLADFKEKQLAPVNVDDWITLEQTHFPESELTWIVKNKRLIV